MAPYQGGWGSSQRQQQNFGRGQGGSRKEPWYDTVKFDRSVNERPKWNLTSYGYQREKDNDVVGDISPEEVRYANMLSMQQGVHVGTLKDEFRRATRDRVDVFQGLARRHQAPSLEGRPIVARMDGIKNISWVSQGHSTQSTGAPFGQPSSGFGQSSTVSPFGQVTRGSQAPFGAAATIGNGSGFGGAFGQPSSGFGQSSTASPFGQPTQGLQAPFGAAATAAATETTTTTAIGSGSGFRGTFGQTQASSPFGQPTQGSQTPFGAAAATTSAPPPGGGAGFGGTFGQTTAQPSSGFGQSSTASPFGQPTQGLQAPFGAAAATAIGSGSGFGGTFGQTQVSSPFGQANQAPQAPFGAGATPTPLGGGGTGFGGTFGQTPGQSSSGFGQGMHTDNTNALPGTMQSPTEPTPLSDEEKALWMTDAFERKGIPLSAPPPQVC